MRQPWCVERSLTDWELALVTVLAGVDVPGADVVRECIPELVVTGGCSCGCRSFDVRDARRESTEPTQAFSSALTPDRSAGYCLFVDDEGRPASVSDLAHGTEIGPAPDPESLIVRAAGLPTRWRWAAAAAVVAVAGVVLGWSLYNGYGPDTTGKQTCAVQASIVERDEDRREWFAERCVDAVPTGGR